MRAGNCFAHGPEVFFILAMIKFIEKINQDVETVTTLTLPWEMRIKSRQRVVLDNGICAGLFLNRGEILRDRDTLASEHGYHIKVVAAEERVSTAFADSPRQLNLACYHLGNRHVEIEIKESWIRYRQDHVLDEMIKGLGLNVTCGLFPFEPETGAYGHHHHASH